jgi:AraC family transcriptional regulator, transcriptional activator of pobA
LYFSVMASASSTSREAAPTAPGSVPAFFLYGEPLQPPDERLVHIETIAARSRLHGWLIRAHRHRDLHQVLLIQTGRVEAKLDGRVAILRGPAAIVVPPGAVHAFRFQPETVGVVISFASALANELRTAGSPTPEFLGRSVSVALHRAALDKTDLSRLSEMLLREFARSAPARRLALSGLVAALLANLQRLLPEASPGSSTLSLRDRELVARFREQLEKSFREHVGIGEYSARLKTSETRLLRACLSVTGESPLDLVHLRLLIEAERQLRYTSMSVTQVAYYLGFEDPAYFSRFFTRRMGISPRAFRCRDALTVLEPASP